MKKHLFTIIPLLVACNFCIVSSHSKKLKPCNQFTVYLHNIVFDGNNVANATSAMIASPTKLSQTTFFGMMVVFDDPIKRDQRLLSAPIARAQGFYFYDMKTAYNAWMAYTLVFNSTTRNGTISIMGADIIEQTTRDLSVVGGTGDFLMTKGIATLRTVHAEVNPTVYFVLQMDVKLYECH